MKLCGGGHVATLSGAIFTLNGTAVRSFPCNIYHVAQDFINCTTTSGRGQNLDVLLSSAQYKSNPLSSDVSNPSAIFTNNVERCTKCWVFLFGTFDYRCIRAKG